jgi:hypothetical protein
MSNLSAVVRQLKEARTKAARDVSRLDAAIAALNGVDHNADAATRPKRVMSASARRRIATAQRARWAKWKKQQRKAA